MVFFEELYLILVVEYCGFLMIIILVVLLFLFYFIVYKWEVSGEFLLIV